MRCQRIMRARIHFRHCSLRCGVENGKFQTVTFLAVKAIASRNTVNVGRWIELHKSPSIHSRDDIRRTHQAGETVLQKSALGKSSRWMMVRAENTLENTLR